MRLPAVSPKKRLRAGGPVWAFYCWRTRRGIRRGWTDQTLQTAVLSTWKDRRERNRQVIQPKGSDPKFVETL